MHSVLRKKSRVEITDDGNGLRFLTLEYPGITSNIEEVLEEAVEYEVYIIDYTYKKITPMEEGK